MASPGTDRGRRATPPRWVGWLLFGMIVVTLVTGALLIFGAPAFVPHSLTAGDEKRFSAESSIRATMLQAIGGLVVLVGLCLTARTVYLARETHVTDRLTKAVDQLGHDKAEVRVGAIFALQRLAENSPIDRGMIASVLKGFLSARATDEARPIGPDLQCALEVYLELQT
jgi:hypothetical protein